MGCSASTQNPTAIASSDERLAGLPRAKRDPQPADKHSACDSPARRFEAPYSGAAAEAPSGGVKVSKRGSLQWACLAPAMLVLEDFLTSDECDGLVALASGGNHLAPPPRQGQCLTNDDASS